MEGGRASFEWKDYADGNKAKIMTLDPVVFIRRFLLHILPGGFVRIRPFGFLANRARERNWRCAALCPTRRVVRRTRGIVDRERMSARPGR